MGILDSILGGGGGPKLNVVPLDGGTQQLINQQQDRATQSTGQIAEKANAGVADAGRQPLLSEAGANQRAAQTGEDPGMLQAIRNQYNKTAGEGINSVVRSNQNMAAINKAQLMSQASRSMIAQQQVQTQNYAAMTKAMMDADMARAQVLSNVLGVAGMGAGMYLAGRGGGGQPRAHGTNYNDFKQSGFDPADMERESYRNAEFSGGR